MINKYIIVSFFLVHTIGHSLSAFDLLPKELTATVIKFVILNEGLDNNHDSLTKRIKELRMVNKTWCDLIDHDKLLNDVFIQVRKDLLRYSRNKFLIQNAPLYYFPANNDLDIFARENLRELADMKSDYSINILVQNDV